jgi:hypothetical protein
MFLFCLFLKWQQMHLFSPPSVVSSETLIDVCCVCFLMSLADRSEDGKKNLANHRASSLHWGCRLSCHPSFIRALGMDVYRLRSHQEYDSLCQMPFGNEGQTELKALHFTPAQNHRNLTLQRPKASRAQGRPPTLLLYQTGNLIKKTKKQNPPENGQLVLGEPVALS